MTATVANAPGAMTERQWQQLVIDFARLTGWRVAHFRPAMVRSGRWATPMQGDVGFPDLILARNGEVVAAELKVKGKVTPEQQAWIDELGGDVRACVWRPQDWPTVQLVLSRRRAA
jgi:hypothetical protein